MGALLASVILLPQRLPSYNVDMRKAQTETPSAAASIWLRPTLVGPPVLPSLCSFVEGKRGLRYLGLPYTRSSTGALRIEPIESAPDGSVVLVVGAPAPPCRLIARLGALSGTRGLLFRGVMKLAGLQVLRLPS